MKLPNPDQAIIPSGKLEGYSLNREHSDMVRSAWIVRNEEDFPRLITCYIL